MKQDRLLEVFDGKQVAPGAGILPLVGGAGGGLPEGNAPGDALVYGRGGVMTVDELRAQGASGNLEEFRMQGGARRRLRRATRRRRRQIGGTRKQKEPRVRFNLRAQIRLRSRSQRRH